MSDWSLRFRRRLRVAPGVTLNLSKSGVSTSLGVRGAHVTLGHGGVRQTVGLPGSGLFLTRFDAYRPPISSPRGGSPPRRMAQTANEPRAPRPLGLAATAAFGFVRGVAWVFGAVALLAILASLFR